MAELTLDHFTILLIKNIQKTVNGLYDYYYLQQPLLIPDVLVEKFNFEIVHDKKWNLTVNNETGYGIINILRDRDYPFKYERLLYAHLLGRYVLRYELPYTPINYDRPSVFTKIKRWFKKPNIEEIDPYRLFDYTLTERDMKSSLPMTQTEHTKHVCCNLFAIYFLSQNEISKDKITIDIHERLNACGIPEQVAKHLYK